MAGQAKEWRTRTDADGPVAVLYFEPAQGPDLWHFLPDKRAAGIISAG